MTAVLLDGTATARQIKDELRAEIEALKERSVRPGLGVVLAGENPASSVYVRNKTRACDELGIYHETALLTATANTDEVAAKVQEYGRREDIHGILVQLPLPASVDASRVLSLRLRLPSKPRGTLKTVWVIGRVKPSSSARARATVDLPAPAGPSIAITMTQPYDRGMPASDARSRSKPG